MENVLKYCFRHKKFAEIIYLTDDGKLTQRKIKILSLEGSRVKAHCFSKKQIRYFKYSNILSVMPVCSIDDNE